MPFHIPHNIFEFFAVGTNDHVDMAAHNAPAINFKAFVLLTMLPAVQHNMVIFVADKKVDPVYNGKTPHVRGLSWSWNLYLVLIIV